VIDYVIAIQLLIQIGIPNWQTFISEAKGPPFATKTLQNLNLPPPQNL